MPRVTRKTKSTSTTEKSDLTILMNWIRDNDLKSKFPDVLKTSYVVSPFFFLFYFVRHPIYWIFINKIYNNSKLFELSNEDVFKTMKEIIYYTKYNSFGKSKVATKENPLIKILKNKFPFYKKEEICMVIDIIDNSEDKDTIYEMFGLNNVASVKKLTKKEIVSAQNKINMVKSSDDALSMLM